MDDTTNQSNTTERDWLDEGAFDFSDDEQGGEGTNDGTDDDDDDDDDVDDMDLGDDVGVESDEDEDGIDGVDDDDVRKDNSNDSNSNNNNTPDNKDASNDDNTKAKPDLPQSSPPQPPSSSSPPSSVIIIPNYATLPNLPGNDILNSYEKELAWLTEESKLAEQKSYIDWNYVQRHASPPFAEFLDKLGIFQPNAKGSRTQKIVRMKRGPVKEAYESLLKEIQQLLQNGHRRAETKKFLPPEIKKESASSMTSPSKRVRLDPTKVYERLNELAWLCEESILLQRILGKFLNKKGKKSADWDYIEQHASPSLREIIERKKTKSTSHCNFYHYLDLKNMTLRLAFQQKRLEVREKLYGGYRREGTKMILPPWTPIASSNASKINKKRPANPASGQKKEEMRQRFNELARLCEESIFGREKSAPSLSGNSSSLKKSKANWDYIEQNASPALRQVIERKKIKTQQNHRSLHVYIDLKNPKMRLEFEKKREEYREELKRKYQGVEKMDADFVVDPPVAPTTPTTLADDDEEVAASDLARINAMKRYNIGISSSSSIPELGNGNGDSEEKSKERPSKRQRRESELERVYIQCSSTKQQQQSSEKGATEKETTNDEATTEWQPAKLLRIEKITDQNEHRRYTVKLDSNGKHGRITDEELILSGSEYDQGIRSRKRKEDGTFTNPPNFTTSVEPEQKEQTLSTTISGYYLLEEHSTDDVGEKEESPKQRLMRYTRELQKLREEYAEEEKRHKRKQLAHDSKMRHFEENLLALLSPSRNDPL